MKPLFVRDQTARRGNRRSEPLSLTCPPQQVPGTFCCCAIPSGQDIDWVKPLVHAAARAACKAFYETYSWFVGTFRDAAEKLRQGNRAAPFPAGCSPPALPFVAG
jgi:hypothetical protein